MTEDQWRAATQTLMMLNYLRGKASARKLRLFGTACCRRVWHLLADERSKTAVEMAERYADGEASERQRGAAWRAARMALREVATRHYAPPLLRRVHHWTAQAAADAAAKNIHKLTGLLGNGLPQAVGDFACIEESGTGPYSSITQYAHFDAEFRGQVALVHDLFGNPFRPSSRRGFPAHVSGLARSIYAAFPKVSRDYAILADALEELGEAEAATHCRQDLHAKGCYVLDWVLRKG
jgi:hypothetical protein